MLIGVITAVVIAVCLVTGYIIRSSRRTEERRYYDAAYKIIKEKCLDQAIQSKSVRQETGRKVMLYLKWKDRKQQGFVFDPESGVRIGRTPGENEICIRENEVSAHHCILYLADGRPAVQDLQSANGTRIQRGFRRRLVCTPEYLYSGDRLLVGSLKIKITIFTFDMAYL